MSASLSKSPSAEHHSVPVARTITPKFPPSPTQPATLQRNQASVSPDFHPTSPTSADERTSHKGESPSASQGASVGRKQSLGRGKHQSVAERSKNSHLTLKEKLFKQDELKVESPSSVSKLREAENKAPPANITPLDENTGGEDLFADTRFHEGAVAASSPKASKVLPKSPPGSGVARGPSFTDKAQSSLDRRLSFKGKHKEPPEFPRKKGRLYTLMAKEAHRSLLGKPQLQLPDDHNAQENENVYTPIEGAQRVEDVGGSSMLAANNFPTLLAHFKLSAVFARFTPSRIDRNRAIIFDAVSLKRSPVTNAMEAVWRRVAIEADSSNGNFRLFDVDKKVFLGSRLDLDRAPSLKPDGIRHFKGFTLGKGRPTIDQWEHFISFWLESREIPVTILAKNSQDIQDIGRMLAFLQAYKLRCREEAEWAQRAHELISAEMAEAPTPMIEVRIGDDFDSKID